MFFIDLTTSARWSGAAVGIVRTERELAKRAPIHLSNEVGYCVYDRTAGQFLSLSSDLATDIVNQLVTIDFAAVPSVHDGASLRVQFRRLLLQSPRLYQIVQRARGRQFSLSDIEVIRGGRMPEDPLPPKHCPKVVRLAEATTGPLDLSPETTIVSGGLDWEFKDLRQIWRNKQKTRFRYAAIVYDMIPLVLPHFVVPGYGELLTDYFGELFWVADQTLCISHTTHADVQRYCQRLGIPPSASDVFPLGCDIPPSLVGEVEDLPDALDGKRFALFVSTIEPRKNHRTLYEAWDRCVRDQRIDVEKHRLVFVGRKGWAVDDLIREIQMNPATAETVLILSDVSDHQLNVLYEKSAFTLFPSLYEGYGLPVAEALAHGKPCIASNAGALRELGGDLVLRIDPYDTLAWADAIAAYMTSPELTGEWESRVRMNHRPVTWDDAAKIFFAALSGEHKA